ncbi:MAG TPA: tetratricopeptide repeat protein [Polyangia bacterium]|nr:tetratricopeptide repeat protein [Polyangia bacterium]
MRRLGELAALLAAVPLLLGFGVLEKRDPEVEAGNAALKAGKAEEALGHYDQAVKKLPADAGVHYDRGAALYALSRFEEAGQEFLRASEAHDPALKASALYNLGNAYFKKEKFKDAVAAYTRTLELKPDDKQAKWNLEIALRKQKDEEKKQQDKKDQDDKDKKNDQKKDDKKDQDGKDKKNDQKKDDKKDQGKQDQKDQDQKQDQSGQKQDQQQPKPQPSTPDEQKQIQAVLDNLERSSKDLEKERAKARAVRRAPPERDW